MLQAMSPTRDPEAENLRIRSDLIARLRKLIEDEGLVVVGARYCLETGAVEFFDGV